MKVFRSLVLVALTFGACLTRPAAAGAAMAQPASTGGLQVHIVAGEGRVNTVSQPAADLIVEVRSDTDRPIDGAVVRFTVQDGERARFADGRRSIEVTTGREGRAAVASLTPTAAGAVTIDVRATFQGQTATATIVQTNRAADDEPGAATHGRRTALVIGGISAGTAAGALAVLNGGGESRPSPIDAISATPPIPLQALPVQFSARLASAASTGTYSWDFGDGSTGTGATPTHVYAASGAYTVTLTLEDDGRTSTKQTMLTVKSLTGRWTCFLCDTPIVNFYTLVQNGTSISGTYNNPAVGFVAVTGSLRTTPSFVTFGYQCSLIQPDGTFFDCSATFTGDPGPSGDSLSGTVTLGGASAQVVTARMP